MAVPILTPEQRWECPSCHLQHVTNEARPHVPMHPCKALAGFLAPFARVDGSDLSRQIRHTVQEREDYIGGELVRVDGNGRPVMSIHTERPDGSHDTHVYAGTAQATSTL